MNELLQIQRPDNVKMIYADDIAVTATGSTRQEDLVTVLTTIAEHTKRLGLLLNPEKSKAVAFKCQRAQVPIQLGGVAI